VALDTASGCGYAATPRLLGGGRLVFDCGDALRLVDIGTGHVTSVALPGAAGDPPQGGIAGDRYVWWDEVEIPAAGLEPPGRSFTLRSQALDGSSSQELLVLTGDEYAYVDLAGVWGSRILTVEAVDAEGGGPEPLVLREADGTEVARFESDGGDAIEIFDGIVVGYELAVDVTRAELAPAVVAQLPASSGSGVDRCAQAGVVRGYDSLDVVRRGSAGIQVTSYAVPDVYPVAVVTGDRLLSSDGAGLAAHGADGTLLWQLPYEVVDRWVVVGGTPFVLNPSQEVVAVDAATGQQAAVSGDLLDAGRVLLNDGQLTVDSSTGMALLVDRESRMRVAAIPECKVR
jgi:hypothetical protein